MRRISPFGLAALAALMFAPDALHAAQSDSGAQRGGRGRPNQRQSGSLKPGQLAPDFELKLLKTKQSDSISTKQASGGIKVSTAVTAKKSPTPKLSSFRGKKPVVLMFGSYT